MLGKIWFWGVFTFCFLNVNALFLNDQPTKGSNEEKKTEEILESIKEFVRVVDQYNLNVTIIGSEKEYGSGGWVKESMSVAVHMPVNDEFITQATLDDAKQDKYLKKLERLGSKEHTGAKARVIQIKDGVDEVTAEHSVNPQYLIDSLSYASLTKYKNGVLGFSIPENETNQILYNYVLRNATSDGVKNVQIITADVVINELEVSENFPADVLVEIKKVLPKLILSIEDSNILARLLVDHLDKKFSGNFQVLVGAEKFALGGKKFVNLEVANTNYIIFTLT